MTFTGACAHGIPWNSGCTLCGRGTVTYTVRPTTPDYTDLLLLIAECLVVLANKASPDAGVRHRRLWDLSAALGEADG
jgi:hypothetical protein